MTQPARRCAARKVGRWRGLGLANYVETGTGYPQERAEMTVRGDGTVDLLMGTQSSGQGHETSYAQVVSEWLGVPFDSVRLRTGDTDFVAMGSGSHSSRSMRLAGLLYDVLPHGFEHHVPRSLSGNGALEQEVVDQGAEPFEVGAADRLRGLDRAASAENRQPTQIAPLLFVEEREAPIERGAKGLLAVRSAAASSEHAECVIESLRELR